MDHWGRHGEGWPTGEGMVEVTHCGRHGEGGSLGNS